MQDNKRTLYFMGGTVLAGLLLVGIMYIFNYIQKPKEAEPGKITLPTSNHKVLQSKIDNLTIDTVNPMVYNSLRAEITSSRDQKMFTPIIATNLLTSLQEKYEELSFIKADRIFGNDPINETELNLILSHLASIGANINRINAYKIKIQQIKYYTVTLPAKVNQFTSMSFDDFNANSYNLLKSDLENLPNLDKSLKNRNSIISARNNCLNRIKSYNSEYLDYLDAMNVSN
jgi:hypothetical protein